MMIRTRISAAVIAIIAGASLASCGHKAVTQQSSAMSTDTVTAPAGATVLVKAGTTVYGKLVAPINTKTTKDGQSFQIAVSDSMFHKNPPSLAGAMIEGHVTGVQAAGLGKPAKLTIVFDDVKMANGSVAPADVRLTSLKAFGAKSHHLRTLGMVVAGAVAGHMAAGKHHGGTMGAVGGFVLSHSMKTDIVVPTGTMLEVKFLKDAVAKPTPASTPTP